MTKKRQGKCFFFSSSMGSTAIEFSFIFIPFIMAMLFFTELCRIVYISSALDLILAESGYRASLNTSKSGYKEIFFDDLHDRLVEWPLFSKGITLNLSMLHCDSVTMLVDERGKCSSTNVKGKPLALYNVNVNYQPLFFMFPIKMVERKLSRKVVFVQEFQRGEL